MKSWIRPKGGFRFWLIVFVKKDFGFVVHSGLRIFHFLACGFRFSSKILAGFLIFVSDVAFPIWVLVSFRSVRDGQMAAKQKNVPLAVSCVTDRMWDNVTGHS